ncbi:hypothetical protein CoNPh26_CDS0112 [Staphylococcus phage S-CoN_Ph26]|nr:hypothetical protein CoNPh26_CDS0112 [Staphylococcus phage S-CoN_Ph26]
MAHFDLCFSLSFNYFFTLFKFYIVHYSNRHLRLILMFFVIYSNNFFFSNYSWDI